MNAAPYFVGVDPGMSGAVGVLDPAGALWSVRDLPTVPLPGKGQITRRLDGAELARLFGAIVPANARALIYVEDVQVWGIGKRQGAGVDEEQGGGIGASTMAAMYGTKVVILAILDCYRSRFEVRTVPPAAWKRTLGLQRPRIQGKTASQIATLTKALARDRARALFPDDRLRLAQHHNRAEALLLAHYAREIWRGEADVFDGPTLPSHPTPKMVLTDADIPFGP